MSGNDDRIEKFLQTALEMAEENRVSKKVMQAMRTGTVQETQPESITPDQDEKWATIRTIALRVLNLYYNENRLPLELWKGVQLVCEEVKAMIAEGEKEGNEMLYWRWERDPFIDPFKITVKRRFNELQQAKFYARVGDLPKAISWREGSRSMYLPNPHFLPEQTKREMEAAYGERLYGRVERGN